MKIKAACLVTVERMYVQLGLMIKMNLEFISIVIESWLFILEDLIPNPERCQYFGVVPIVSMGKNQRLYC